MSAAGFPGFADLDAGGCPTSAIVAGIRYAADNGAKVMNISLGGTSRSQLELDALTYAVSRGVFVSISTAMTSRTATRSRIPPVLRRR